MELSFSIKMWARNEDAIEPKGRMAQDVKLLTRICNILYYETNKIAAAIT
jgi:hypothetical protein